MKKITVVIILLIVAAALAVYFKNKSGNILVENPAPATPEAPNIQEKSSAPVENKIQDFLLPLDRAKERITKKYFGIFITPQNSPVQPEKFSGYHTGTDFEIFPEEESMDVPVKAVCAGKLLMKKTATGYGGVATESCELKGEPITVVYGHLKLGSINFKIGDTINAGDTLGILGQGYSAETGGERKHLHLGFHKGTSVNILGYVQNKSELSGWLDPCQYSCVN